jgi:hypothetical protein
MLAESAFRWELAGGNVESHYNAGVTATMKYLPFMDRRRLSDVKIQEYLTNKPFVAANALQMIGDQYWVATFLNEYETFANWRTGFPNLVPKLS